MCQWKSRKGTNKYKWARHKYTTKSSNTGPDGDNTSGYGHYVYMETSKQNGQGQTAYLKSPALPPSDAHCLTFYYHMYGRDMGSLNVYIQKPKSRKKFLVFTVSGDQGDMWHYQEVAIASTCKYRVVFEGVRGTSFLSDIALDDILFNDGPCY
ncbi:MAM domain-containing protein 2 [Exaiptasia diaphana]|uniref:MAM domain-containing protein n=1 Tax=Exaiptasia diaphana TaxID=2652724 RepID=A0A913X1W9_EXADI|nr:MAM domain-containing protein 2 [Exaiptasia diaphana]